VRDGDAAYRAGDYPKAVQCYVAAIKLQPDSPELYERLGTVYQEQHNQRYLLAFKKAEELRAKRDAAAPPAAAAPKGSPALEAAKAAYAAKDYATALKGFRPLADAGDATAEFALGLMCEQGQGGPVDFRAAAVWYDRAAKKKHAQALTNLAYLYVEGKGVVRNAAKARTLYTEAASMGIASAMFSLGTMDYSGEGGDMDYVSAYVWWKRAANLNHPKAAANLPKLELQMNAGQLERARQKLAEPLARPAAK
jgi:TPR repeat protein